MEGFILFLFLSFAFVFVFVIIKLVGRGLGVVYVGYKDEGEGWRGLGRRRG